jgi:hypothetical protein
MLQDVVRDRRPADHLSRGAQAIGAPGDEIDISKVAEQLKLLSNFLSNMPVIGIKDVQMTFKSIDLIDGKLRFSKNLYAL